MTLSTTTQNIATVPGMEFLAGKGEMVLNASDYDSGELTVTTGMVEIYGAVATFRESQVLDLPPIWCDYTTTAGAAVFKCANIDQIEICYLIWGRY